MTPTTPLRYPGGKGRLTDFIKLIFEENGLLDGNYVEPYAGGAGIAINLLLLEYASCIHINDVDRSVFAFWHSVINCTEDLCKLIRDARLTMSEWRRQKAVQADPDNHSLLSLGFSTFYLNRTNRSGIITGGVIGGNDQEGQWKIDARFNRVELCRRVERIAGFRSRIRIYNLDAVDLIQRILPKLPAKSLVYLDPPYYLKAKRLYKNTYNHSDHAVIARKVKEMIQVPWIVSYDYVPEITRLYRGVRKIVYKMSYSAADSYQGSEVMFFSDQLAFPDVSNPAKLKAA